MIFFGGAAFTGRRDLGRAHWFRKLMRWTESLQRTAHPSFTAILFPHSGRVKVIFSPTD
jgi:hypothetical protein